MPLTTWYTRIMKGHYLDQCPNYNDVNGDTINTTEATSQIIWSMVQYGICLTAATATRGCTKIVNKDWVLIDSYSMSSCVWNEVLLKKSMIVHLYSHCVCTAAGVIKTTKKKYILTPYLSRFSSILVLWWTHSIWRMLQRIFSFPWIWARSMQYLCVKETKALWNSGSVVMDFTNLIPQVMTILQTSVFLTTILYQP